MYFNRKPNIGIVSKIKNWWTLQDEKTEMHTRVDMCDFQRARTPQAVSSACTFKITCSLSAARGMLDSPKKNCASVDSRLQEGPSQTSHPKQLEPGCIVERDTATPLPSHPSPFQIATQPTFRKDYQELASLGHSIHTEETPNFHKIWFLKKNRHTTTNQEATETERDNDKFLQKRNVPLAPGTHQHGKQSHSPETTRSNVPKHNL